MFFALDDPEPEPFQEERAEILVGSWMQTQDNSFTYVFYADGHGTRSSIDEKEYFTWRTRGSNNLIIDDGASIESWTFTVDADVLTIYNDHIPGVTFNYIRTS